MRNPLIFTLLFIFIASSAFADPLPYEKSETADILINPVIQYFREQKAIDNECEAIQKKIDALLSEKSRIEKTIADKKSELNTFSNQAPVLRNLWEKIPMGEFESKKEYQVRLEKEKSKEELTFKKEQETWKNNCQTRKSELQNLEISLQKYTQTMQPQIDQLQKEKETTKNKKIDVTRPTLSRTINTDGIIWPTFNRDTMKFESLQIKALGSMSLSSIEHDSMAVLLYDNNTPAQADISFSTLDEAKEFKDRVMNGEIKCVLLIRPILEKIESPIILQEEISEMEETYMTGENAVKVGVLGLLLYLGSQNNYQGFENLEPIDPIKPSRTKKIIQPEIKVDGCRFHFLMKSKGIYFVDKNNEIVPNINVSLIEKKEKK